MLIADLELEERLRNGIRELGISVGQDAAGRYALLLALLDKWNRAFNLTAVRDPHEMVARHILDSLSVKPFLSGASILDVGTGAGFPGLVLAVADPDRQFCLLDSGVKKVRFVRHAVAELGLGNVQVEHSRVEQYVPVIPFDTVVCRAFSSLAEFVSSCAALAAADGRLVAMKGRMPRDEIAALPSTWSVVQAEPVTVPGLSGERHIIVLERSARKRPEADS